MPPHFFAQGLRVNAAAYVDALTTVVKPWIESVSKGRPYVFQQDSAPAHTTCVTQEWLADNFYDHVTFNLWPPSSPDLNPLDYYIWGVIEREANKELHNTKDSLKDTTAHLMGNISKEHLLRLCSHFRSKVESVIAAYGGFIK